MSVDTYKIFAKGLKRMVTYVCHFTFNTFVISKLCQYATYLFNMRLTYVDINKLCVELIETHFVQRKVAEICHNTNGCD